MYLRFLIVFLISVMSVPAVAQPDKGIFYDCDMTRIKKFEFWVSSKIGIVILDSGRVVVSDGVTLAYGESLVDAAVTRNTESDLHINWALEGGLREGEVLFPDAEFAAKLSKSTNRIRVSGKRRGDRRFFSGRGQCTVRVD